MFNVFPWHPIMFAVCLVPLWTYLWKRERVDPVDVVVSLLMAAALYATINGGWLTATALLFPKVGVVGLLELAVGAPVLLWFVVFRSAPHRSWVEYVTWLFVALSFAIAFWGNVTDISGDKVFLRHEPSLDIRLVSWSDDKIFWGELSKLYALKAVAAFMGAIVAILFSRRVLRGRSLDSSGRT
jgi:hypothetical protein